jgi:NAD(P)-dependent dehydrogenase (short-subunit alcohol dehydrogenase family)
VTETPVAIVTGASRGIGRAIAIELARNGYRLVLVARTEAGLRATAQACATDSLTLPIDLRSATAAREVVEATRRRFGVLHALVNNAGATRRGDFFALDDDDWNDGFALKFFGAMRLCRTAWPELVRTHGSLVNIAGVGGRTASADFTIGGSVNAALLNLTKALADRGLVEGVRVNGVNPGYIATDRLEARLSADASRMGCDVSTARAALLQRLGIARFGTPQDVAALVAYLLSPAAAYHQGSLIDIDGGLTRTL